MHRSVCIQGSVACVCEVLLHSLRKCYVIFPVTQYQKNFNTHHHAVGFDVVSLKTQVVQMLTAVSKQQR